MKPHIEGLTSASAARYLLKDGPNRIKPEKYRTPSELFFKQFSSPAIITLLFTALIYGALGNEHDSLILLAIIIPSGILTFFQENRAHQIMLGLQIQLQEVVRVIRDSQEREIPLADVVRGDIVLLGPGELVPADVLLIEGEYLEVDESLLTGEVLPQEKSVTEDHELFMGTHVISGSGLGRVIRTGSHSKYGVIAARVLEKDPVTSFELGSKRFGYLIARIIIVLVVAIFLSNILLQRPIFESLLFSLALAVGLTPQMLPVIISVCLSTGARKLAHNRVLIKRLDAIEDFGSMNLLCTDKTGTLTRGKLTLKDAVDIHGQPSDFVRNLALENALLQASSANAIDQALRESATEVKPRKKLGEVTFSFQRRCVSVLTDDHDFITKGALNEVLSKSSMVRVDGQILELNPQLATLRATSEKFMNAGYKVIAVASKTGVSVASENEECALTFEGLIIIEDPPKVDARNAIAALEKLGIEIVLVTGDALLSAIAIARAVGIPHDKTLRGSELATMNENELRNHLTHVRVLAEIDPLQKQHIVQLLRDSGNTVGFLGDGINDIAALHDADVAISVDGAVDIAKSASSVILLEKELSVILDGVKIGRSTFQNTLKYIKITMCSSFGNVLSMAIASLFLPFLPMLPTQILILNFLSDLPAIAISGDAVDEIDLASPSKWRMSELGHFMVLFGVISSIFDITIFLLFFNLLDYPAEVIRSLWFAASLCTEVIAIYLLRTHFPFWRSRPGLGVLWIGIFTIVISAAVPAFGIFRYFQLPQVNFTAILILMSLIVVYASLTEFIKIRRYHWSPPSGLN